jgi:hypothetical protein
MLTWPARGERHTANALVCALLINPSGWLLKMRPEKKLITTAASGLKA